MKEEYYDRKFIDKYTKILLSVTGIIFPLIIMLYAIGHYMQVNSPGVKGLHAGGINKKHGIIGLAFVVGYDTFSQTIKKTIMKTLFFLLSISLLFVSCVVHTQTTPAYMQPVYLGPGIGLGTIIAVVISWGRNKSILLAILHGILGWLYVIYALLVPKRS